MFEIRFTSRAIADLEELKQYISNDLFNPKAATEIVGLILKKTQMLVSMPQVGARLKTNITVLKTYRFIQCKHYLVFYKLENKTVSVSRILYERRDYLRLLKPNNADKDKP